MKLYRWLFPKYGEETPFWRVFIHFWAIAAAWFFFIEGIRLLVKLIRFQ